MFNSVKKILLATFFIAGFVSAPDAPAAQQTAEQKALAAATTLVEKTIPTIINMRNLISSAGDYIYSDAIALIAPMSDLITSPIWLALKKVNDKVGKTDPYIQSLLDLAALLVDNRERASKADITALQDALDANMSADDFTLALGSPFKTDEQVAKLTAIIKNFAKPITKKQDTKSIVALILNELQRAQSIDRDVFAKIADLIVRRLDDDEVLTPAPINNVIQPSTYEFQSTGKSFTETDLNLSSVNLFDTENYDATTKILKSGLNYENSWISLRSLIEKVCGHKVYKDSTDSIDLTTTLGKSVSGVQALRTELLSRLVAPITIDEMASAIDRLSSIEPFSGGDIKRFVNRIRLLRTLITKNLVKQTNAAAKTIRLRTQFLIQSKVNEKNSIEASMTLADVKAEVDALLSVIGSEAFNDQIPEAGTIVALQWKNPATGLFQYVNATEIPNTDPARQSRWELRATSTDYIDDTALFYVIANADRLGFQCVHRKGLNNSSPGFIQLADSNASAATATGIVSFVDQSNDPSASITGSINAFKSNKRTQFFMEGTRDAASFKSGTFVSGVVQQSGYLSVGPDGIVRSFNAGTKSPSGSVIDGVLTAGPWETFSLVFVDQFFIDLARTRTSSTTVQKLDFWRNAIKQVSIDASTIGQNKRLAVINELLHLIQSLPTRAAALSTDEKQKFADTLNFASSMLAQFFPRENDLRVSFSKVRAEFDLPVIMATGGVVAPLPLGLPLDGQTVVLFVPQLSGASSGRYLEVLQESLDETMPLYAVRASATDPVSPRAQFKVSVFRDFVSFESVEYPGNVLQVGVADTNYKNLVQEARMLKTRATMVPLAKDSRGLSTGFWEDVNKASRLQLIDHGSTGAERFKCAANDGFLQIGNDGYFRCYDVAKISAPIPTIIRADGIGLLSPTSIEIIPVKMLYTKLGDLQKNTDDLSRVRGYKGLISQIETDDDIFVLVDEVGSYLDEKRSTQKDWSRFDASTAVKNAVLDLLKTFRTSFKNALSKIKSLNNRLSDVEEKFVIAPVFSTQNMLKNGDIIALGWKDDTGSTKYASIKNISFAAMKSEDLPQVAGGPARLKHPDIDLVGRTVMDQLEIGDMSPIDGKTHFRVLMHENSGIITLQSLATQKNIQAIYDSRLIDIEDWYDSPDHAESKDFIKKYRGDLLGLTVEGQDFEQGISDIKVLEEFSVISGEATVSFKSVATGGFISINPTNRRLVTIDPITMRKAGMDKAGTLVPTPREQFIVIPISDYISKLGNILNETDRTTKFAKYLYYVSGAITDADRKVFLDSIEQEILKLTASTTTWNAYVNDEAMADARASMNAIMNQIQQDQNYQKSFKDDVDRISTKLDAGAGTGAVFGMPAKGSIVVLKTLGDNPKYVKAVPSQFDGSVYVLAVGDEGGDDLFDPACQFYTDARNGKLGLKSAIVKDKYLKSIIIDSVVGASWIAAKKNAQTELSLTGATFSTLGDAKDQTFTLVVADQNLGKVQIKSEANGGYLSWVVGFGLPTDSLRLPADITANEPQVVSFVPSTRLRTIDSYTLKPFGQKTRNVNADSLKTVDLQGTTLVMTVFDEYYKMLMAARDEKNYIARFSLYARILPLVKSEKELGIFITELQKMVDVASQNKDSDRWKDFSSEDVRSKFNSLIALVQTNFTEMLVGTDRDKTPTVLGQKLNDIASFESNQMVLSAIARFNSLQNYLDVFLTPTCVDDFLSKVTELVNDRSDGVVRVEAVASTKAAASLNIDFITTKLAPWISESVLYNKVITQTKKKDAVSALADQVNKPVTYAEFINYIDQHWINGRDRFTANEKAYVLSKLQFVVFAPWLALASAEDFDLKLVRDLLLRARANHFRDDQAAIKIINDVLPLLVYPKLSGTVYMALMTDVIKKLRAFADQSVPAFAEAKKVFLSKAALWNSRVILSGAGQLDLFNYATTLNVLLKDPLISPKITNELKVILSSIASALSAQGISFVIASDTDGGSVSTNSGVSTSSGLSI
jgi:hypothetical protein